MPKTKWFHKSHFVFYIFLGEDRDQAEQEKLERSKGEYRRCRKETETMRREFEDRLTQDDIIDQQWNTILAQARLLVFKLGRSASAQLTCHLQTLTHSNSLIFPKDFLTLIVSMNPE